MLTADSLKGGHLAAVVKARMLGGTKDPRFKSGKPDPKLAKAWEAVFGWAPPDELLEWAALAPSYEKFSMEISDVWMLGPGIGWVAKKKPALDKLLGDADALLTLLTGLEYFGDDPSGDRAFVSTLPRTDAKVAEVHVYDHENGELDGAVYYSIADMVFSCWTDEDDDESPADEKLMAAFNATMKKARAKLKPWQESHALFERVKWLWSLPLGEPGYHFAQDMARAPTFEQYEAERALLPTTPWLANYWLLAHWFLGNEGACAEVVKLAAKAPGALTPALAKVVGALLATPKKAKLGKLGPAQLQKLRAAVRKNADPSLLEPAARAEAEKSASAGVVKADKKALLARLAAGEDGWKLIAEFPDDVDAHDAVLTELARKDAALAETFDDYKKARAEDDVYDAWPGDWSDEQVDPRFSPVVSAAFRQGLRFDADNPRAFSPLVNTLRHFDDDAAMQGYAAALEHLRMDDARLEYVLKGLFSSKHAGAKALINRAAWRFFDFFDETVAAQKKTEAEGATLDNLFRVHSQLLPAVMKSISFGDDESEKLVDKVLSITSNMSVLGTAYASAFRQVGNKKLTRHLRMAKGYCLLIDGFTGEFLPDYGHFNFAEAALAYAKLEPTEAKQVLGDLIRKERPLKLRLDVVGGALAGALFLSPEDPELIRWTDRILANRTGEGRLYGALVGVGEGRVTAARDWLRPHFYLSKGLEDDTTLGRTARAAFVALGETPPPEFDDTDEFANRVKGKALLAALEQRHLHRRSSVFERMREEKLTGPEVIEVCARELKDRLRFSDDPGLWDSDEVEKEATRVLAMQGPAALPAFASLLSVEGLDPGTATQLVFCMSIVTDAPALLAKCAALPDAALLALLEQPTPEVMGALDLVGAIAFARLGSTTEAALTRAFEWRLALYGPEYDHWAEDEPTGGRLAILLARTPGGKKRVQRLAKEHPNHHVKELLARALKTSAPVEGFKGKPLTLTLGMRGPDRGGCTYTCVLTPEKSSLRVEWRGEQIHFNGVLANAAYAQQGAVPLEHADLVARALTAIGFTAAGAKKKR
ncbi:MAG: hypothetical protein ACOZQL_26420 [Myxococcota bacterium]